MRLGEHDAFPAADIRLRKALRHLDTALIDPTLTDQAVTDQALTDQAVTARSETWKPWRALAVAHLIAHAESLPNQPSLPNQASEVPLPLPLGSRVA
jgi:3-methyladenine DNA glycosylase/8-oxoguanine DNA glycosylase